MSKKEFKKDFTVTLIISNNLFCKTVKLSFIDKTLKN